VLPENLKFLRPICNSCQKIPVKAAPEHFSCIYVFMSVLHVFLQDLQTLCMCVLLWTYITTDVQAMKNTAQTELVLSITQARIWKWKKEIRETMHSLVSFVKSRKKL
jgi:hypothetical protein